MNNEVKALKVSPYSFIISIVLVTLFLMNFRNISINLSGLVFRVDNVSLPFIINAGIIGIAALISSYRYIG